MGMNSVLDWLMVGGGFTAFGGAISWLVFLPYKKRNEALKNEVTSVQIWKDLCTDLRGDNEAKDKRIDELYEEIKKHRDEKNALYKEKENLAIENTKLEAMKCTVRGCVKRDPPSWF